MGSGTILRDVLLLLRGSCPYGRPQSFHRLLPPLWYWQSTDFFSEFPLLFLDLKDQSASGFPQEPEPCGPGRGRTTEIVAVGTEAGQLFPNVWQGGGGEAGWVSPHKSGVGKKKPPRELTLPSPQHTQAAGGTKIPPGDLIPRTPQCLRRLSPHPADPSAHCGARQQGQACRSSPRARRGADTSQRARGGPRSLRHPPGPS